MVLHEKKGSKKDEKIEKNNLVYVVHRGALWNNRMWEQVEK